MTVGNGTALLSVDNLSVAYGGLKVLKEVSFEVGTDEIVGLVGPNGAGKSTAINAISGLIPSVSGQVAYNGRSLHGTPSSGRARMGIARTFQNLELFHTMTVRENVQAAMEASDSRQLRRMLSPSMRRTRDERVQEAIAALHLESVSDVPVMQLPYGTKKLVELARVFVRRPKLVLLDEPVAGLNRDEKDEFVALFASLHRDLGLSGLLVEHDMPTVQGLCSRIVVLDAGAKLAEGSFAEIIRMPAVIEAYLGPVALVGGV